MDRLLNIYERQTLINSVSDRIYTETRGEITYKQACIWLQKTEFFNDWTVYESQHRPVDIIAIIFCRCE